MSGALAALCLLLAAAPTGERGTAVSITGTRWMLNGRVTYAGAPAEGLLMNVRMVNAVFEDRRRKGWEREAEANTKAFVARVPEYVASGVRAFTVCLQGGMPGYEGAINSAFERDGSLRAEYMGRVRRVIEACDRSGAVVILGCYYQRQDQVLEDEAAVRRGVREVCAWLKRLPNRNVVLEIANEYGHAGFDHRILRTAEGQAELIRLAREAAPGLLIASSPQGNGQADEAVAGLADFVLIHLNGVPLPAIEGRIAALRRYGKPMVCNEDEKVGDAGADAASRCVAAGASWGFMCEAVNQRYPFRFDGPQDDPVVYGRLAELARAARRAQ